MLEEILKNFSINSLKTLAGKGSLNFFEETLDISPDFYELNSQSELLIQAILNSNPTKLFFNKKSRDYFIDRMHRKNIAYVIENINGKALGDISREKYSDIYNNLKLFCNDVNNLSLFLNAIALPSDLLSQEKINTEFSAFKKIKPKYGLYPYQVVISEKTILNYCISQKKPFTLLKLEIITVL